MAHHSLRSRSLRLRTPRFVLLALSCAPFIGGCTADLPPVEQSEAALLLDGQQRGAARFWFLPPIVHGAEPGEILDETVEVHVTISEVDPTRWTRREVTSGPAEIDPELPGFVFRWHTRAFALDPALEYTVVASVAGRTAGLFEVQLVEPGSAAPPAPEGVVRVVVGRTLPIAMFVEHADTDADGISDFVDLCPTVEDPAQEDFDQDGIGDECECLDVECPDDDCNDWECSPWTGRCRSRPLEGHCDDGNACTTNDTCHLSWQPRAPATCGGQQRQCDGEACPLCDPRSGDCAVSPEPVRMCLPPAPPEPRGGAYACTCSEVLESVPPGSLVNLTADCGFMSPESWTFRILSAPEGGDARLEYEEETGVAPAYRAGLLVGETPGAYLVRFDTVDEWGYVASCEIPVEVGADIGLHVDVTWDQDADLDLHLLAPAAARDPAAAYFDLDLDCWWRSPSPDWGVPGDSSDNPALVVDGQTRGPETIALGSPATGVYTIGVHEHCNPGQARSVAATARVHCGGALVGTFTRSLGGAGELWTVATVDTTDCSVRPVDAVQVVPQQCGVR